MPKILQELKHIETTDVSNGMINYIYICTSTNMYLNNWMTEHFSKRKSK